MVKDLITAHMVVKNEDRFIWYAISSILPFADKILIYDTGSTENTLKIINSFKDKKIYFKNFNIANKEEITNLRNEQIKMTRTDWIWVVDGDEIYPSELCEEIVDLIKNKGGQIEGIVVGRYDLLGDIYHYQSESVGTYELFGRCGHLVLRLINLKNIPGLNVKGIYPYEGFYDSNGLEIIYHYPNKFVFTRGRLFHAMYLPRSSLGANLKNTFHRNKWKIELGNKLPEEIALPEVFFKKKPDIVPSILKKQSIGYLFASSILTPIKKIKRKFI